MLGVVKWFDRVKGFGVIESPEEKEFFIHANEIEDSDYQIEEGQVVSFIERKNNNSGKKSARKCKIVSLLDDFEDLMYYLDKYSLVIIQVKVKRRGPRGNPYTTHELRTVNILKQGVSNILKNNDKDEVFNKITEYFEESLDNNLFLNFCEHIENAVFETFNDKVASKEFVDKLFDHFGNNLNQEILFSCWKSQKFNFIGYNDSLDFQIPENLILQNTPELAFKEFERIFKYDYDDSFLLNLLETKFKQLVDFDLVLINELYEILKIPSNIDLRPQKEILDQMVFQKLFERINLLDKQYHSIDNNDVLSQFTSIITQLPSSFNKELKSRIDLKLENLIENKSKGEFLIELWIKDVIKKTPKLSLISSCFESSNFSEVNKVKILVKASFDIQLDILKRYFEKFGLEKSYNLLKKFIDSVNKDYIDDYSIFFNSGKNWDDKKDFELIDTFSQHVLESTNEAEKIKLLIDGYVDSLPVNLVLDWISNFENDQIIKICTSSKFRQNELIQILNAWLSLNSIQNSETVLTIAKTVLSPLNFDKVDKKVFSSINDSLRFVYWERGLSRIVPELLLVSYLDDKIEKYKTATSWIKKGLISTDSLVDILICNLDGIREIDSRPIFQTVLNQIDWIIGNDSIYLEKILKLNNECFNLILWHINKIDFFDFEFLKRKFILFTPNQEVKVVKKLFFLKSENKFDLTVSKLDSLFRIDLDLYNIGKEYDHSIDLDISSDIIIKSIVAFSESKKFLTEKELFDNVLSNLKYSRTKRFKFEHYFENCTGRASYEFDYKSSTGNIFRKFYNEETEYYIAIHINYSDNPDFIKIKDEIKMLPGARWNSSEKHWGVNARYENEVYDFGKKNGFRINTDIENRQFNNLHFSKVVRKEVPENITFCEGRLANQLHNTLKIPFWWCAGNVCLQHCDTRHKNDDWQNYTLGDFLEILDLNSDEINHMGDLVPKGNYFKFIGLINRFNKLLDKLYCHECNEFLYPKRTSHFAANNYTTFTCENNKCSNKHELIYLNRCVTNSCENIIDNRVSKECPNGLVICDKCCSCCSHNNMVKRHQNLKLLGGYIHPEFLDLIRRKAGHRERSEQYCYKCSELMIEKEKEVFHCNNCKKIFDLRKYKISRSYNTDSNNLLDGQFTLFVDSEDITD